MEDGNDPLDDDITLELMPQKSRHVYSKVWKTFKLFAKDTNFNETPSQALLLKYFMHLRNVRQYKSSSMWKTYSIINTFIKTKYSFHIGSYPRLKQFIKSNCAGDVTNKASIFTQQDLMEITRLASQNDASATTLVSGCVAIISHHGGLRVTEAFRLKYSDLELSVDGIWVHFKRLKTRGRSDQVSSKCFIPHTSEANHAGTILKYLCFVRKLDMVDSKRLWMTWDKDGKFSPRNMGFNRFQTIGKYWGTRLGYDGEKDFSFHSFRRTTCSVAVDNGCSTNQIMSFCGWRHASMVQEYQSNSVNGLKLMGKILGNDKATTAVKHIYSEPVNTVEAQIVEHSATTAGQHIYSEPVEAQIEVINSEPVFLEYEASTGESEHITIDIDPAVPNFTIDDVDIEIDDSYYESIPNSVVSSFDTVEVNASEGLKLLLSGDKIPRRSKLSRKSQKIWAALDALKVGLEQFLEPEEDEEEIQVPNSPQSQPLDLSLFKFKKTKANI